MRSTLDILLVRKFILLKKTEETKPPLPSPLQYARNRLCIVT